MLKIILACVAMLAGTASLAGEFDTSNMPYYGAEEPETLDREFDPALECAWYEWNKAMDEWNDAMLAGTLSPYHSERVDKAHAALRQWPREEQEAINKRANWRSFLELPDTPVCELFVS